jgi:serine/threonine protein phosphatase 1
MTFMTLLAIPDIHGNLLELRRVLALADARYGRDAAIVFLGDLVDRGVDSRGVIDTILAGLEAGRDWTVLRGNHDQMFLEFIEMARAQPNADLSDANWLSERAGGRATLQSYGVSEAAERGDWTAVAEAIPSAHLALLESLPRAYETEAHIFVHAGIAPGVALADQDPHDLIWIREPFLSDRRSHGKLVVHGHTVCDAPEHHGNRVNLDAGAGYDRPLQLARLDARDVFLVSEAGEEPLLPLL